MHRSLFGTFIVAVSLCISLPAGALDPTRSIQQMYHRAYTSADGLPSGITAITQTTDGYLWVGSGRGLFRFNGQRFEPYAAAKLLSPGISALTATESGDLWIGYAAGNLSRMRAGEIEHFTADSGAPPGANVDSIRLSKDGEEMWAIVSGRMWRRWNGQWQQPLGTAQVWSMNLARDGVAWLKNGDNLFYCRPRGVACETASAYAGGVIGFTRDRDGRLWTSDTHAPGKLYRIPDVADLPDTAIPPPDYRGALPGQIGGRFFLDRDFTVWNIHFGKGLLRARPALDSESGPRQLDAFTAKDGLTHDLAERLFEDREGSIWVSTKGGLDQFRPANVVLERAIPTNVNAYAYWGGFVGDTLYVHANTSQDNSNPYAGARGPLYRVSADGAVEPVADDVPAPVGITRTEDGAIWLSTMDGLQRLQGGRLVPAEMPPGTQGRTTLFVLAQPGNGLLLSVYGNGVWERRDGKWHRHPTMPEESELKSAEVYGVGGDGAIWMAKSNPAVLIRHHDGQLERFSDAQLDIGPVWVIAAAGNVEYFGGARGIGRYEQGSFHALHANRVPVLTDVRGIAEVGEDLWVFAAAGILRFDRNEVGRAMRDPAAAAPAYELFDQADGLPAGFDLSLQSTFDNAVLPRPDGRVYFITGAGMVWIDPKNIHRNPVKPTVAIASLTANGEVHDSPRELALPAGTSSLEINYAALSFVEPGRMRFRYRLEGVDADWIDPGNRRQAFYTRLDPGTYRFTVTASNDAGIWNEEGATLAFSIAPTFVQSLWFKLLMAAALLALAFAAYASRLRLETARIRRQFEVRMSERERIARELHDTLLQGVQGLVLQVHAIATTLPADGSARDALEQTLDRADVVLQEGRDRVRDLRLPEAAGDLPALLAEAARAQIPDAPPRFDLIVEGTPRALQPATQEEALRIAEEALRNAVRHAHAHLIEIILTYHRASLQLLVRDDGIGMDKERVASARRAGHFGLLGMTERAARVGGSLTAGNREPSGTEVLLCVPARKAYSDGKTSGGVSRLWKWGRR